MMAVVWWCGRVLKWCGCGRSCVCGGFFFSAGLGTFPEQLIGNLKTGIDTFEKSNKSTEQRPPVLLKGDIAISVFEDIHVVKIIAFQLLSLLSQVKKRLVSGAQLLCV